MSTDAEKLAFAALVDTMLNPYNGSRVPHEVYQALLTATKELGINAGWIVAHSEIVEDGNGNSRYCWLDDTSSLHRQWLKDHPHLTTT